ncbi:putative phosphoglycerate mutase [Novosphingobium hassiacum]|uniref:Putative phosphoglycerate mutase n=1 Tax=Novosphingobium hassiacum TaxID=173676 RepID=A0A7W5ZSZ4_9SPHN|nr:histidine phosphatase family protein [Novosphingobium hassiacum]MBB3859401.1 putative phosphoglycerate mutase [Novosphingobium hassiacum]
MPDTDALFIIVRHGNTFEAGEPARRVGARTDLALTLRGAEQAEALGAHFAALGMRFGRILVSPLQRTRQTADAIIAAQVDRVVPEKAEFLREIDHGPDENQTEDVVLARIGAEALAAWDRDATPPPDWSVDADARIAAWRELFAGALPGQPPTLLVTSNGAARFALMAAGVAPGDGLKLATGSYGVVHKAADGTFAVAQWSIRP